MNKEKLSIAYVFDGKYEADEGVPSYIGSLGDYYSSLGHKVNYIVGESNITDGNIYSLGHTKSLQMNGNRVEVPLFWVRSSDAAHILRDVRPDILHVQMPYSPNVTGSFIREVSPDTGVVGTFHIVTGTKVAQAGSYLQKIANLSTQKRLDNTISVSPSAQNFARSVYGIDDSEIIPPPIDLEHYKKGRKLAEYDDGKTNIVFMGRLEERKGCKYLLDAIKGMNAAALAQTRVLIAGKGELMGSLKAQSSSLGLDSKVKFLGFVSNEDKPDLLATADIAVFPSTEGESFGIVLIEAMASGAGVVIGGNNVGYKHVLNNRSETLFNPQDQPAFSRTMANLILGPRQRKNLYDYQQELVKNYDVQVIGSRILEKYRQAIAHRSET